MAKKFTDLTGDGKVTRADILKGRGVPGFAKGKTMAPKGKKRYAEGGNVEEKEIPVTADRILPRNITFDLPMGSNPSGDFMGPAMPSGGGMPSPMGPMDPRAAMAAMAPRSMAKRQPPLPIAKTAGYTGLTFGGDDGRLSMGVGKNRSFGVGARTRFKEGGAVKKMAKGGSTASKRGDGCAIKGKTKGRIV